MNNSRKQNGGGSSLLMLGLGLVTGAAIAVAGTFLKDKFDKEGKKEEEEKLEVQRMQNDNPYGNNYNPYRQQALADARLRAQGEPTVDGEITDMNIESFLCPITQQVMTDPVLTKYGHLFERKAIEDWLKSHNTCPLTG